MSGWRLLLTLTVTGAVSGCSGWLAVPWTCSTVADCDQWCAEPGSSFEGTCTSGYCVSSAPAACVGPADAGSHAGRADAGHLDGGHVDGGDIDAGHADAGQIVDAGSDGGEPADAGEDAGPIIDAGSDGGPVIDGGADAGSDGGPSASWEEVASGTTNTLFGVVALDDGEAWAAGAGSSGGLVLQYSPSTASWSSPSLGVSTPLLYAISGVRSGGVTQLWAVGPGGALLELDGASGWSTLAPFGSDDGWGVWAVSSTEAWAVGTTASGTASVWHLLNGTWTSEVTGLGSAKIVFNAWAASPGVVWVAAESQSSGPILANWSPATSNWSTTTAGLGGQIPSGVGGTSADDVWAATVGSGGLSHWDGESWTVYPTPNDTLMTSVWAASPTDVWAVGYGGTVLHWNGSPPWVQEATPTSQELYSVSGNSTTVWAVGVGGTILRRAR